MPLNTLEMDKTGGQLLGGIGLEQFTFSLWNFCSSHSQNTVVNVSMLYRFPLNNLKPIARDSPHKGQLYVFITGRRSRSGLGLANCIGCVCKGDRPARSITKYGTSGKANKLLFTAEVRSCLLSSNCIRYMRYNFQ